MELFKTGTYGNIFRKDNIICKQTEIYGTGYNVGNIIEVWFYLNHKAYFIPKIIDVTANKNTFNIFMEYAGIDLYMWMQSSRYDTKKIPSIFKKLVSITKWFGDRKLVYVDFKPNNICIDDDDNIFLIDYGSVYFSNREVYYVWDDELLFQNKNIQVLNEKSDMASLALVIMFLYDNTRPPNDLNIILEKMINFEYDKISELMDILEITKDNINIDPFISDSDYIKRKIYKYTKYADDIINVISYEKKEEISKNFDIVKEFSNIGWRLN
jgi:serine/threonine protein kinase